MSELAVARRNEKWLRSQGALEYGKGHYPFILLLHSGFLGSLIGEYLYRREPPIDLAFLALFILLLGAKIWVISSLGRYWNTKIFRIPGSNPVRSGPYRILKHPNYVIVVLEFIVAPMVFHLYYTLLIFTVLNAIMLGVRIRVEERVWAQ
ncbi:MAG: isoprenylcysteine carboxylmethyltransferase family protein [Bacteroidota bacterium]|nr:isoprenylcysteine carboxylmethyltransferase family protein [Bacteroidota bacterium]